MIAGAVTTADSRGVLPCGFLERSGQQGETGKVRWWTYSLRSRISNSKSEGVSPGVDKLRLRFLEDLGVMLSPEADPTGFLKTLGGKVSWDAERCLDCGFAAAVEGKGFRLTGDSMETGLAVVKAEKEGIDMPREGLARLWPEAALVDGSRSDLAGKGSGCPERSIGSSASRCMSITIIEPGVERALVVVQKEAAAQLKA
jgi:hypothetical protein